MTEIDLTRMSPAERSLRAQLASHVSWARTADPAARTAPARRALEERFAQQAREMHPTAGEEQVLRVAEQLRKAYFASLSAKAAAARRAKARVKAEAEKKRRSAEREAAVAGRSGDRTAA
ncbi:hypothetical protein [Streptomyces sp. ST2-7A]|uniref:hypothetical protein n=1 Tax=Streptomyces sp. ST2-7A TaxID=2907214 RepID=UPI001F462EFD|nr:hypothetical protein [Streptomyces sp. ST2-7A]MCE7083480.1 hypothetical protein [Streptomyces sp. ST2-7A]